MLHQRAQRQALSPDAQALVLMALHTHSLQQPTSMEPYFSIHMDCVHQLISQHP
jgi:hypothetical protein